MSTEYWGNAATTPPGCEHWVMKLHRPLSALALPCALALALSCSGESQAAEGTAAKDWAEAKASALETLGHVRDGLSKSLESAKESWDENRAEWRSELSREFERMGVAIEQLRAQGRERAAEAGEELKRAKAELAELMERGAHSAGAEWVEQSRALRERLEKLERHLLAMTEPEHAK